MGETRGCKAEPKEVRNYPLGILSAKPLGGGEEEEEDWTDHYHITWKRKVEREPPVRDRDLAMSTSQRWPERERYNRPPGALHSHIRMRREEDGSAWRGGRPGEGE